MRSISTDSSKSAKSPREFLDVDALSDPTGVFIEALAETLRNSLNRTTAALAVCPRPLGKVKLNRNVHAGAYDEHQVVVPGVGGWHD